jgi:hypothetical protein
MIRRRMRKICLAAALFFCISMPVLGIGTVAGTNISAGPIEINHDGITEYSNSSEVTVFQDHGLNLTGTVPPGAQAGRGAAYYFPHTLTNIGNGSALYHFGLAGTTATWSSTLFNDDNINGIHEAVETTSPASDIALAEDASYYLFVAVTSPLTAAVGDIGSTTFSVSDEVQDGLAYNGANGSTYGGPDMTVSPMSVRVMDVDDLPPTITNVLIDDRTRYPNDIISSACRISARIFDDRPQNIARIEVLFNTQVIYNATSADWQGIYNPATEMLTLNNHPPLPVGTYELIIRAWDTAGNQGQYNLTPLYVRDDSSVVSDPVNYPNPFRPAKGEQTTISYILSRDMDITLYCFDITATLLWKDEYKAFEEGGKAGYNEIYWNGKDAAGRLVSNGMYIFKIVHNGKIIRVFKVTVLDTK